MKFFAKTWAFALLLFFALPHNAESQDAPWVVQGPSGCSDEFGAFDAYIPGMRGFGSCNRGGFVPGTNVMVVTNRNASGVGSFAEAVNAECPKVVLFAVAGLFDFTSLGTPLRIGSNGTRCDHWSIVGASAPGNVVIEGATGDTYGLAAVLQTRGSYWTIDHMTFTGGGSNDAINVGSNTGVDGENTSGILLNNNFIWGGDEIVQFYTDWNSPQFNVLLWQNYIGHGVDGYHGPVIIQNSARNAGGIRNYLNDNFGRQPLTRADGTFWANNLDVNGFADATRIQPCTGGAYSPIDPAVRMHVIDNVYVSGVQGDTSFPSANVVNFGNESLSCTTLTLYESGNRWRLRNGSLKNCDGHGCVETGLQTHIAASVIPAVYPAGYVPEAVPNTQQGLENFAALIKDFAGARPTERLPFIENRMEYGLNTVTGSGPESSYVRTLNPPSPTIAQEGGIGVITPVPVDVGYDPTSGADNPCGEDMPAGQIGDAVQTSGLTRLHEWVIGCFYDSVMPAAYREDRLQNYGPATGGGFGAPTLRPKPPILQ